MPACLFSSCLRDGEFVPAETGEIVIHADSSRYTICFSVENHFTDSLIRQDRLDIFLYNTDGLKELELWRRYDSMPDSVCFLCPKRLYTAVAIVNSPRSFNRKAIERFDSIELLSYEFDEDSPAAPIMSGICNLRPDGASVINLQPLMSRVTLAGITNTMKNYVLLEDPRIYLENMNAGAEILRAEGFRPSEIREGYITAALPYDIGLFRQTPGTSLFCYPNDAPSPTMGTLATALVLECEIKGTTCRFPVSLPSLRRNSTVSVELTVNGPGYWEATIE